MINTDQHTYIYVYNNSFTTFACHFCKWHAWHYITPQNFTFPPSKNRIPTWSRWRKMEHSPTWHLFRIFRPIQGSTRRGSASQKASTTFSPHWELKNQAKPREVDGRCFPKRCILWRHRRQFQSPTVNWYFSKICTQRRLCPQCTLRNQGCRCFPKTRTQQRHRTQCSWLNQGCWCFPRICTPRRQRTQCASVNQAFRCFSKNCTLQSLDQERWSLNQGSWCFSGTCT